MSHTAVLAAYALASLSKSAPSKADVEAILKATKISIPKGTIDFVFESIDGRDVNTLIAEGAAKMSAVSASAGAGSAAPAGAAGASASAGGAAKAAPAAAKAAVEEESDDDIGFGLFD